MIKLFSISFQSVCNSLNKSRPLNWREIWRYWKILFDHGKDAKKIEKIYNDNLEAQERARKDKERLLELQQRKHEDNAAAPPPLPTATPSAPRPREIYFFDREVPPLGFPKIWRAPGFYPQ